MIDPIIFTIRIGSLQFPLRWYGVIVMIGVIVGSLIVERELKRRGENGDRIWDALIWVLPAGIIGARLWYVVNATLGGNRYYVQNPIQIINIPQGGLHIFGGLLFGAIALLYYIRQNKLDPWVFLDSAGPAMLIGQAIGRIANFINQELYGPPTTLPWGIKITAEHGLAQYADLQLFPVETTRFHPTFAYEMLWNLTTAGLLLWLSRRYEKQLKPGTLFAAWLIAAGLGRTCGTGISYSAIVSATMAIVGAIMLMARYKAINLKLAENWEEEYKRSSPVDQISGNSSTEALEEQPVEEASTPRAKKTLKSGRESTLKKKAREKIAARKAKETTSTPATRAKKPSS